MPTVATSGTAVRAAAPAPAARPRRRRRPGCRGRTLLAAAGGLALFLAFPGCDLSLAAPCSARPRCRWPSAGVRFRTGLWLGLVHGLAFFVPLLSWTGIYVGPVPLAGPRRHRGRSTSRCWAAHRAVTARLRRLAAVGGGAVGRRRGAARPAGRWAGSPGAGWASARPRGRFIAFAAYGGVPLVSFAVALTGTLLAAAVLGPGPGPATARRRRGAAAALRAAALAVARRPRRPGAGRRGRAAAGRGLADRGRARRRRSRVVQGNVPRAGLDFNAQRRAVLDNHVQRDPASSPPQVAAGEVAQPDLVHLAGEQLRHRPLPQRRRRRRDRPGRAGDRRPDPGRRRGQRARPVHQQHRDRLGPGDRAGGDLRQAAPGPVGRVRARPVVLPVLQRQGRPGPRGLPRRRPRSASSTSAAPRSGTSSASRSPTTAWSRDVVDGGADDDRGADQQRDLRLHRREPAAAGHGPAARGGVRPIGRRWPPPAGSARSSPPTAPLVRSSDAVHPGDVRRGRSPSATGTTVAARVGAGPEWALTALGLGACLAVVARRASAAAPSDAR